MTVSEEMEQTPTCRPTHRDNKKHKHADRKNGIIRRQKRTGGRSSRGNDIPTSPTPPAETRQKNRTAFELCRLSSICLVFRRLLSVVRTRPRKRGGRRRRDRCSRRLGNK